MKLAEALIGLFKAGFRSKQKLIYMSQDQPLGRLDVRRFRAFDNMVI